MGEREEEREKRLNGHTDKWADRQTDNDYRVMCFFFSIFIFLLLFFFCIYREKKCCRNYYNLNGRCTGWYID